MSFIHYDILFIRDFLLSIIQIILVTISTATGCFSSDTLVTLINLQQIPIEKLRIGDELLTIDGTKIVSTEMIMMLDQNQHSSVMFYTIITGSEHKVSLTSHHLIGMINNDGDISYIPIKDIKHGDILRVITNGQIYSSPVIDIKMEIKNGYYAPLTMTGTLLVNNIDASCFSNVKNHDIVQFYMSPLRWYYRLSRLLFIEKPFGDKTVDGIHYIAQMLYEIAQSIYPSILHFT
ncbi:unnamed protein product [Rotaria sordida]|uniref:Hint domain-containing protein n=1 Tax=Rotaria sordida TaxID=392033 RepID=A0A819FNI1_9BILA|nr:unnamed protein product [Rotaria sordida]CAF3720505.1 unnamed protein product [Rotaria sordida]CAF3867260.1 unnamed protein product [Rotaria sordida]